MTTELKIKEFNLDMIPPSLNNYQNPEQYGAKIVVIGKPSTGKSTLITSILHAKSTIFPCGMFQSGSEEENGHYSKITHPLFVYNSYNEDAITRFVERQKIARKYLENPWSVLLLDDCTDSKKIFNTPLQQGLYKRGRHSKMLYILSLQYALDIPPAIRTSIDYTFLLREPNIINRKKIYENLASIVGDFKTFCDIMDTVTEDYTALVIKNMSTSNNIEDNIFYYKAPQVVDGFKFGCEDYHIFGEQRYDSARKFDII